VLSFFVPKYPPDAKQRLVSMVDHVGHIRNLVSQAAVFSRERFRLAHHVIVDRVGPKGFRDFLFIADVVGE
jgi:hypothetical protein